MTFKITDFYKKKELSQKITIITAYDYFSAKIAQDSNVDAILVGDSLGMVIQGNKSTISVTLDEMIYHAKIVKKGAFNTFVIVDMPYLSYHNNINDTITNAGKIIKETYADALKLEINNIETIKHVEALINAQIPIMAHIGLTPQSINMLGQYRVHGKTEKESEKILEFAKLLQSIGVFAIVLECIPKELATQITSSITIPTIGIGSGLNCDGQILVFHDLLGINNEKAPKFVKKYLDSYSLMKEAVSSFKADVESQTFPNEDYSY